jgi:hypothetical protein
MNIKDAQQNSAENETKIWKNILWFCKEYGYKFVDDSFPPCDKSLYIDLNSNCEHHKQSVKQIKWLRPEHIRTHSNEKGLKWTVINNPNLNDIKQGLLGNCWLLSGISF